MPQPSFKSVASWAACCLCALGLTLASLPAAATVWEADALGQISDQSASASYASADGLTLSVTQDVLAGAGSMTGGPPGYEGLWLGADNAGYHYSLSFSQPVASVSFSFIALSALADVGAESLGSFHTNALATISFSSADASAAWDGATVLALDEDSRGTISFSVASGGLLSLDFMHGQPGALNGFIINRVEATAASPVPEASSALLLGLGLGLGLGLLMLGRLKRPRRGLIALGIATLSACGGGGTDPASTSTAEATAKALAVRGGATVLAAAATSAPVTQRDAVRLAEQASFGPSEALVGQIRSAGLEAWIASQLALNVSRYASGNGDAIHKPDGTDFCRGKGDACWRDWYSTEPVAWDFYRNATGQPDQLRQRVAYTLGQIIVISNVEVAGTYGYRFFHNMLLDNAFGSYREVLRRTARSPLMGDYLDHVNNSREFPNENFARELLQLFAIGTCQLKPDGTLEAGRCLPTYDNALVRNYAFALTGWTYPDGGSSVYGCYPEGANCTYYGGDMVARPALADDQPRTLLGGASLPGARSPAQALDAVLDSIMNQASMAPFIGRQLIQHLVKSNPSPAYIKRVATAFNAGRYQGATRSFGSGVKGDLGATVAAILLDSEARNSAPPLVAEKLREPVLMMTGVIRALNGGSDGDALGWWWGEALRQHVFRSPSVFSHFPPTYPVVGSKLVGPAFGIYNVNTALARLNFLNQLIPWGGMDPGSSVPNAISTRVDLSSFEADAGDPAKLVDRLVNVATGGRMTAASKAAIVTAVNAWTPNESDQWKTERVKSAAYLVFASPAYQVLQ